jgi:glycosyltransferase involved in cell wall biosynthesis
MGRILTFVLAGGLRVPDRKIREHVVPLVVRVTIGVPVFNAESLLERALDNLARQSFQDWRVIVLDNASTDGTAAIAKAFTEKDPRFSYHLQPFNKGCRQNFVDALTLADSPYFMWRAYDDQSSTNYIETLAALLDANPYAALAVGRTILAKPKKTKIKRFPHRGAFEPAFVHGLRSLLKAPPSWIYGLYRTKDLRWSLEHVVANYRHVHAFDPLTILPFVIQSRVVGTDDTDFIQGFVDRDGGSQLTGILDPQMMQGLRDDFRRYCRETLPKLVDRRDLSPLTRAGVWMYTNRSYRWDKILNARLRMMLGERPHAPTTKYDTPRDVTPAG